MPWNLDSDRPIFLQIVERLESDIVSGKYAPGEKLPAVRELAVEAAVNPNTMQKACAELERIGLTLGADVPFCIRGGLTRTRGIGEALESHDHLYSYSLVVIQPCPGLSTAQVFSRWHESGAFTRPDTESALRALESGDLPLLCASISNVLQPVSESLRPEIGRTCALLEEAGALKALMTGSGSAVFGVFRSPSAAERAFRKLSPGFKTIFLCHTQHDSVRIMEE